MGKAAMTSPFLALGCGRIGRNAGWSSSSAVGSGSVIFMACSVVRTLILTLSLTLVPDPNPTSDP